VSKSYLFFILLTLWSEIKVRIVEKFKPNYSTCLPGWSDCLHGRTACMVGSDHAAASQRPSRQLPVRGSLSIQLHTYENILSNKKMVAY
jgi:hypothetical protein